MTLRERINPDAYAALRWMRLRMYRWRAQRRARPQLPAVSSSNAYREAAVHAAVKAFPTDMPGFYFRANSLQTGKPERVVHGSVPESLALEHPDAVRLKWANMVEWLKRDELGMYGRPAIAPQNPIDLTAQASANERRQLHESWDAANAAMRNTLAPSYQAERAEIAALARGNVFDRLYELGKDASIASRQALDPRRTDNEGAAQSRARPRDMDSLLANVPPKRR